jgi:hypothetical protein
MKRCPICRLEKPLSAFSRNVRRSDGVQSYCTECRREYMRRHYARNASKYRAFAAARNERRRATIRQVIREAKDRPCSDCGLWFPAYVMDFDHGDGDQKRFNIGRDALNRCSEDELKEEIEKCEVVCANCHRMRTHGGKGAELGRQDSNLD